MLSEVLLLVEETVVLDFPSDWKNELKREKRLLLTLLLIIILNVTDININFIPFLLVLLKVRRENSGKGSRNN